MVGLPFVAFVQAFVQTWLHTGPTLKVVESYPVSITISHARPKTVPIYNPVRKAYSGLSPVRKVIPKQILIRNTDPGL